MSVCPPTCARGSRHCGLLAKRSRVGARRGRPRSACRSHSSFRAPVATPDSWCPFFTSGTTQLGDRYCLSDLVLASLFAPIPPVLVWVGFLPLLRCKYPSYHGGKGPAFQSVAHWLSGSPRGAHLVTLAQKEVASLCLPLLASCGPGPECPFHLCPFNPGLFVSDEVNQPC